MSTKYNIVSKINPKYPSASPRNNFIKKQFALLLLIILAITACTTPDPEIVKETVISEVPVTVETFVEVTKIVEVEVEATREVEVEVTRVVESEVTRVVEVEVTRVVEVTPVPTETPTPAPTATAQTVAAPPPAPSTTVLQSMITTRDNLQAYIWMIDIAVNSGRLDCQETVDFYDTIANARTHDVSSADDTTKNGYAVYRFAVESFANGDGIIGITTNCRNLIASQGSGSIPFSQWGVARTEVDAALQALQQAVTDMGGG